MSAAEKCGLTGNELRIEIDRRIAMVRKQCANDGMEPRECGHCIPGIRHPVGNCYVCGCGPAPGAISWYPGLKELPVDEVNAACRERMI